MIAIAAVTLLRAEGLVEECDVLHTLPTLEAADALLRQWARTAPSTGGYDKCDFTITWQDGQSYTGRFDLQAQHATGSDLLATQVREFLGILCGRYRPEHLSDEEWARAQVRYAEQAADAAELLDNYALAAPKGDPLAAVRATYAGVASARKGVLCRA